MKKKPATTRKAKAASNATTRENSTPGRATPSRMIDARIKELSSSVDSESGRWRGEMLARVRDLIKQADPNVVEEWKWNVPVWSHAGIICTGETYKTAVKLTFAQGASLKDPAGLFNASLEGKTRRVIDLHQGEEIDAKAFKALIRAAAALNEQARTGTAVARTRAPSRPRKTQRNAAK